MLFKLCIQLRQGFHCEIMQYSLLFSMINFSVIKFWDTRNLKCPVVQACPHPDVSTQKVIIDTPFQMGVL